MITNQSGSSDLTGQLGSRARTHVCHVQKDSVPDASRLLDLGGLAVDRVELGSFGGRVVHLVTADPTASACPSFAG